MKVSKYFWFIPLLTFCSCASLPKVLNQHVVFVNQDGIPLKPSAKKQEMKGSEFQEYIENILTQIKNHPPTEGKKKIMVFVHGGLNTQKASLLRAAKLHSKILGDGYYPIFINWKSGLISSYWDHLVFVRQGRVHRLWGPLTAPFYLVADLGRAITRIPVVGALQFRDDLSNAFPLFSNEQKNVDSLFKALDEKYRDDLEADEEDRTQIAISIGQDNRKNLKKSLKATVYTLTSPVTNILISPFVDGFGKSAWVNMSRRTKILFQAEQEFDIGKRREDSEDVKNALNSSASGSISKFMESLSDLSQKDNQVEITLVGHSMGTIVLNNLLRNFDQPFYKDIVYMAAACTISDFEKSVLPYLKKSSKTNFYNLVLHPDAETGEYTPQFLDLPPRGSLLIWIDNFLSTPETVPDRTLGKWNNIVQATHMIPPFLRKQVHIKAFAVGESDKFPEGNPQKHGDFTNEKFWKQEFWEPKGER